MNDKLFFDIKFEESIEQDIICIANEEDSKKGNVTLLYSFDQHELTEDLEKEGFIEWDVGMYLIPSEFSLSRDQLIYFIKCLGFEYKNFLK